MTTNVEEFLQNYSDDVQAIARNLRAMALQIMPDAQEVVTGHKNISYSTDAGVMKGGLIYIAPFKDSVNLGFVDGIDLPDPQNLLKGTGKRLRHIKFKSLAEIETHQEAIFTLLQHAKSLKS